MESMESLAQDNKTAASRRAQRKPRGGQAAPGEYSLYNIKRGVSTGNGKRGTHAGLKFYLSGRAALGGWLVLLLLGAADTEAFRTGWPSVPRASHSSFTWRCGRRRSGSHQLCMARGRSQSRAALAGCRHFGARANGARAYEQRRLGPRPQMLGNNSLLSGSDGRECFLIS